MQTKQSYLVTAVLVKTGSPREPIQRRVRASSGVQAIAAVNVEAQCAGKLLLSAKA